ncbi:hypothetical protein PILCRDRAFT_606934 [Piloderma croceum F 1598]|uniref:Uncharacterized protein n=1 Tax=Piloderma croceum (strain F 1598) TaxID=765440 RepID=A0A0C3AVF1_PILCF|nr:hypothetical protein PILCRDRAFT_606934 [Piloderma croceum F 1598]
MASQSPHRTRKNQGMSLPSIPLPPIFCFTSIPSHSHSIPLHPTSFSLSSVLFSSVLFCCSLVFGLGTVRLRVFGTSCAALGPPSTSKKTKIKSLCTGERVHVLTRSHPRLYIKTD